MELKIDVGSVLPPGWPRTEWVKRAVATDFAEFHHRLVARAGGLDVVARDVAEGEGPAAEGVPFFEGTLDALPRGVLDRPHALDV
jgi:hypothetical protein